MGEKPKTGDEEQEDRINIFSLASGHLYERLLRCEPQFDCLIFRDM